MSATAQIRNADVSEKKPFRIEVNMKVDIGIRTGMKEWSKRDSSASNTSDTLTKSSVSDIDLKMPDFEDCVMDENAPGCKSPGTGTGITEKFRRAMKMRPIDFPKFKKQSMESDSADQRDRSWPTLTDKSDLPSVKDIDTDFMTVEDPKKESIESKQPSSSDQIDRKENPDGYKTTKFVSKSVRTSSHDRKCTNHSRWFKKRWP